MSIIIGADIVPVESNSKLFIEGQAEKLIGRELLKVLKECDFRIFNLETPLVKTATPIIKEGANFWADTECVNGLKEMNCNLLTIANNHILDQGEEGLISTISVLRKNEIDYVGAGKTIYEAQKPYFFEINNVRYGVYACTEHEFSVANKKSAGANPFDPLESLDHIEKMKTNCDYAIVLYHGGREHYRYPSPQLQRVCRRIIDKGANLVLCQHSHCVGCKEEYKNGTIVYGQGNFLFDHYNNEYWNSSLLVLITDEAEIRYMPIVKTKNTVRLALGNQAKEVLDAFENRSAEICNSDLVETKYTEYVSKNIDSYILILAGLSNSLLFRILNRLSRNTLRRIVARKYKKTIGVKVRNCIECETHREMILEGLQNGD